MSLSGKKRREIQRSMHLIASVILLAYLYTPLATNPIFGVMVRVMVVPMVVGTGLVMWLWPRLRRKLLTPARERTATG